MYGVGRPEELKILCLAEQQLLHFRPFGTVAQDQTVEDQLIAGGDQRFQNAFDHFSVGFGVRGENVAVHLGMDCFQFHLDVFISQGARFRKADGDRQGGDFHQANMNRNFSTEGSIQHCRATHEIQRSAVEIFHPPHILERGIEGDALDAGQQGDARSLGEPGGAAISHLDVGRLGRIFQAGKFVGIFIDIFLDLGDGRFGMHVEH